MLQNWYRTFVICTPHQHLAQECKCSAIAAFYFHNLEQLALCFFPLMQVRVGTGHRKAAFPIFGRSRQADIADRNGVTGATERQVGVRQRYKRRGPWVTAYAFDEFFNF